MYFSEINQIVHQFQITHSGYIQMDWPVKMKYNPLTTGEQPPVNTNYDRLSEEVVSPLSLIHIFAESATRNGVNVILIDNQEEFLSLTGSNAWANRGPSEMNVWVPYQKSAAKPRPAPTIASTSKVLSSLANARLLETIKDQYDPSDSKDNTYPYLHWWPKKNSLEYVQYDFAREENVSESKVYWFDDGPWGGCRIPLSYKVLYLKDGNWLPVEVIESSGVTKDAYNTISFKSVKTKGLKLEIQLPVDNSSGIHEWKVK